MDVDINVLIEELKDMLNLNGKQRVFEQNQELKSSFFLENADPEAVTKDVLIEPVIRALGLKKLPEKHFELPQNRMRKVDYRLKNDMDISFLVEAKPLNADLFEDIDSGAVNQIKELFLLAIVKEGYAFGIATDGIKWVFINKEREVVYTLDIRYDLAKIKEVLVGHTDVSLQRAEEEISKKFYDWYTSLLHGGKYKDHNNKIKNISVNDCLVENIQLVTQKEDREQVAQSILNRLIFIKFLQSKDIIQQDILDYLSKLEESELNNKLRQLFFEVLNTEKQKRSDVDPKFRDIPYLNGSLFVRTEIETKYPDYKIKAFILREIIAFLNSFKFVHDETRTDTDALDPEILGYIFEKAMTAAERNGTGAYYTPKIVTQYLSKHTIEKKLIERANEILKQKGQNSELKEVEELYELETRKQKEIFNHIMTNLTICDNACGSGTFLLSAANTLLRVYKIINEQASIGNSEIDLKKLILKHSLYGVDINPNAIEIAKLRLWLWLVSSYSKGNIEPLTNIEYNIRLGNSLIGYIDIKKVQDKLNLRDWISQEDNNSLKILLAKREREITEYKSLSGSKAKELKERIEERDIEIRNLLDVKLYEDIYQKKKITKQEYITLKPFHWGFEFGEVFNQKKGFDIIIGNPPYGNILPATEKKALYKFETINANEIAANFIERTLALLAAQGITGLIVANSIAINSSTAKVREIIRRNMSKSRMALFGTRPAKIFADAEIRVLIFLGEKDNPEREGVIYTTEAIKFTTEQKARLFEHLSFESTEGLTLGKDRIGDGLRDSSLPKVGNKTIRAILIKLKNASEHTVKDKIDQRGFDYRLQFRKTGGYWLNALEKMPYTSTKIETIKFDNALERDFTILLINSSLFYLYWSTYSNLRDFPKSLLDKFPFPSYNVIQKNKNRVDSLRMQITTNLLKSFLAERGRVGEFRTGLCKDTIDEIDELLGKVYGLSKSEVQFIKNYDSSIRRKEINKN